MTRKIWSISGLATELGRDRRTIAKALERQAPDGVATGGGKGWFLATAIAALLGPPDAERLDPAQERARKDKELADKTAMENEFRRGGLVEVAAVEEEWRRALLIVRQRILAIPSRAAAVIPHQHRQTVFALVEREVRSALIELSGGEEDAA